MLFHMHLNLARRVLTTSAQSICINIATAEEVGSLLIN
jgi:hypothetical protein